MMFQEKHPKLPSLDLKTQFLMMKTLSNLPYTTKDLLLSLLTQVLGHLMKVVSLMDVHTIQILILITESNVLDGENLVLRNIGLLETLGELLLEMKDISI